MSRVHCLACGSSVVVDPHGMCPEGHVVGAAGVRVERAMGGGTPHPDEPEPWVARVELDAELPEPIRSRERTIRPVSVGGAEEPASTSTESSDHDAMLRELHALGVLDEPGAAAPDTSFPAPAPSLPAPDTSFPAPDTSFPAPDTSFPAPDTSFPAPDTSFPAPDPRPAPQARVPNDPSPTSRSPEGVRDRDAGSPSLEDVAAGFAELSALEAAVQALGFDDAEDATTPTDPRTSTTSQPATSCDPVSAPDYLTAPGSLTAPAPLTAPDSLTPGASALGEATGGDGSDFADFAALFDASASSESTAPTRRPTGYPPLAVAPPPPAAAAPVTDGPDAGLTHGPSERDLPPPAATPPGLDITNFTARGGKVGAGRGGRRRRFGR